MYLQKLTILYDSSCGLCLQLKMWMMAQPAYCDVEFMAASSPVAQSRYGTLANTSPLELVAIDDRGAVYRNDRAWLMCLWVLREHRALAVRLSSPALQPLARRAWSLLSNNRKRISEALALHSEDDLMRRLTVVPDPIGCRTAAASNRGA